MKTFLSIFILAAITVSCKGDPENRDQVDETVEIDSNYCNCNDLIFDDRYNHFYLFERRDGFTGKCEIPFPNGNIQIEKNFDDGKMQGKFIEFHENGRVWRERNYDKNFQDGDSFTYSKSGKLIAHALYKRGKLKEMIFEDRSISLED
jgi:hypothetical protein